jgi:endonuclease/exonuclease/phosphatase family metal-dependent hydrolase
MFIKTMSWNARSLSAGQKHTKIPELSQFIENQKLKLILISETWLNERSLVSLPHFSCYRADRHRGGVCIFIHNSISHSFVKHIKLDYAEAVFVKIHDMGRDILIASIYCSPAASRAQAKSFFEKVLTVSGPVIVAGDFNAKHQRWNCNSYCRKGADLVKLCDEKLFSIHGPDGPTLIPNTGTPAAVDFVLCKNFLGLTEPSVVNELSSDHFPLIFSIRFSIDTLNDLRLPNYAKANWRKFRADLDLRTKKILDELPSYETTQAIDHCLAKICDNISESASKAIPKKLPYKFRYPFSEEIRLLTKERNFYRNKFIREGDPAFRSLKNQLDKLIKSKTRELNQKSFEDKISKLNIQDLSLHQFTKYLKQKKNPSPPLKKIDGSLAFSSRDKSIAFADAFKASHLLTSNAPSRMDHAVIRSCEKIALDQSPFPCQEHIRLSEVIDIAKTLKVRKAPGHDNITNVLIRNFPNSLFKLLVFLFNSCCSISYFPLSWKVGKVIPIEKPGKDKSVPSNSRPISLLSNLGKMFEKLLLFRFVAFEKAHNIFIPTQFGFRNNHSTVHQVLRITESAAFCFNKHRSTGMVLLDVEKAFDTVWHNGLLHKLLELKFPLYLIKIISSYLKDRKSFVSFQGSSSEQYDVNAGVPQGSILAPFLFNIFINDLKKPKNCELATYADDTVLFCNFSWKNLDAIKRTLESGLEKIHDHFKDWKISINSSKTEFIVFTRSTTMKTKLIDSPPVYDGQILEWKQQVKYLGVILDTRLSFKPHIHECVSKANKAISTLFCLLKRNSTASVESKLIIYKTYIRPIITYASTIFHNCPKSHFSRLQILQNKCLRMILSAPYDSRITKLHAELKIPTIEEFVAKCAKTFYEKTTEHENDLIRPLGNYSADSLSFRLIHNLPRAI